MKIGIIAALGKNRSIGFEGELPWKNPIKADWENLKKVTKGSKMIMGRKSYLDQNRVSSNAGNIVLSSQNDLKLENGFLQAKSLNEALKMVDDQEIIWILGGQNIFEESIKIADIMVLTHINEDFKGDRFFPEFQENDFLIESIKNIKKGKKSPYDLKIITYSRKNKIDKN